MSEDDYIMILFNLIQLINFVMWSAVGSGPNKSRHAGLRKIYGTLTQLRIYTAQVITHNY